MLQVIIETFKFIIDDRWWICP